MKRLIYDDYIEIQEQYQSIHGVKSILLMQVGGFFELYALDKKNKEILDDVSSICNFQITRKDKKKELSRNNPYMAGFPLHALDKYITILLSNNYTIPVMRQITPPPEPERKVTHIYSPGTIIDHIQHPDTNHLMSIYIEHWKSYSHTTNIATNRKRMYVGISVIDLSTGSNSIYETYSKLNDKDEVLNEIFRSIKVYNPSEIIITYDELPQTYKENKPYTEKELEKRLEITSKKVHFRNSIKSDYKKKTYQNQFLKEIFPHTGVLSPIEYLDLEQKDIGLLSYILLLNFVHSHNETIIKRINKPTLWNSDHYLVLTNNSIEQLDVVSLKDHMRVQSSLFSIINNTSTAIGRRLLKERLLHPIKNIELLQKRYSYIDEFLQSFTTQNDTGLASVLNNCKYKYQCIEKKLSNISDIERLHRKLSLCLLEPYQFVNLDIAYSQIIEIISFITTVCPRTSQLLPPEKDIHTFKQFIEEYRNDFDMDEIAKYNSTTIVSSFFKKNRVPHIDKVQLDIDECMMFLETLQKKLSELIDDGKDSLFVKLNQTNKDGYYLSLTYKRSILLKKRLYQMANHVIKLSFPSSNDPTGMKIVKIKPNNITFSSRKKSECIIQSSLIEKYVNKMCRCTEKMKYMVREAFFKRLAVYDGKYMSALKSVVSCIAEIDVIKSNAKTSILHHYSKPNIKISDTHNSFLDIKQIRHPIIEKIQTEVEYVPNDITLGMDTTGMLLYGTNASGKSSLMKSIGLNLIMAQAGMYVAAKEMIYYPYDYLFTRIRNNDNLFRGQSSFAVEIEELRTIINKANNRSIVLGDELCSGTETNSALSIFATSLYRLSKYGTTFILATHLHELCNVDIVKNMNTLQINHLKVIYENNKLIYDRKLEKGSGHSIYGLEVCKAMGFDEEFLEMANTIRKKIMSVHDEIKPTKTSKYNANLYLQSCLICGAHSMLETHHIQFQCSADEHHYIDHVHKDNLSNLVPLCKQCHIDVHNKDLEISGYIQTTNGKELQYKQLNKSDTETKRRKRKKYGEKHVRIIQDYYKKYSNCSKKDICFLLKKECHIAISVSTFNKIINNQY